MTTYEYLNDNFISYLKYPDSGYHRSHWILHNGRAKSVGGTRAEFESKEQLDFFAKTLGFTYELVEESAWRGNENNMYREYRMNKNIVEPFGYGGFWKLEDLPEGVKPIKALNNGSIVTCYYRSLDDVIEFYRPNPNAKEVYQPLNTELHIAHRKIYGSY